MVDGVRNASGVLANLLIGLHLGSRGDLALEPTLKGVLLSDLAGSLNTVHKSSGIVSLGVCKVSEVKSRLDVGVGGCKVDAASGAGTGDIRGHAEGVAVGNDIISKSLGVEREGDLIAVHHEIGSIAIVTGGVGGLAAQEDAGIRVHGGLVGGDGAVQLPHDDALGVVEEVLANTRNVLDNRDAEALELGARANAGVQEEAGSVNSASAEDGLLASVEGVLLA